MRRLGRQALLLAGAVLSVLSCAPAAAHAIAPAEAIRLLNVQRAANGIPGDVAEAPGLTDGCSKHGSYIALNGGALVHGEEPAKPGYTPEGDRQTLASSGPQALSAEPAWSESTHPWALAPIQRFLVFDPEVAAAGYADDHGPACMRVRGGRAPAATPELYSVPGPGATGVPYSELSRGSPYAPQQLVDLPADTPTGPNILLFTRGLRGGTPLAAIAFSLTGPQGPVDARFVTEGTANAVGSGGWFRGGGVLVPVAPLEAFSSYTARVVWHRDAEGALPAADAEQVVTFETAARPNAIEVSVVSNGDVHTIRVTTPAPNPALRLTGPGRLTDIARLSAGTATYEGLAPGTWTACGTSGGRSVGFIPASACEPFTASARVQLALAQERGRTSAALHVPPVARGRRAQVTVSRYRRPCRRVDGRQTCTRITVGRAQRSEITLRSPRMRLKLPPRRDGVKVSARVVLAAFQVGDAPYLPTVVRRTWE